MKSSKHLDNALEAAGCIEEKLKVAVEACRVDIDRFASSYELKEINHELRLRIPRHPATQPTNIRPPVPRSSGRAVGAQRRRFALLV